MFAAVKTPSTSMALESEYVSKAAFAVAVAGPLRPGGIAAEVKLGCESFFGEAPRPPFMVGPDRTLAASDAVATTHSAPFNSARQELRKRGLRVEYPARASSPRAGRRSTLGREPQYIGITAADVA